MADEKQELFNAVHDIKKYHENITEFLGKANILIVSKPSTEYSKYLHLKRDAEYIKETLDFVEEYLNETIALAP